MKMRIKNIFMAIALMILINPLSVFAIDYYVEIVPPSPSIREGSAIPPSPGATIDFTVNLVDLAGDPLPVTDGDVTVVLSLGGSAEDSSDYTVISPLSVTFDPAESSQTFNLQVTEDNIFESTTAENIIVSVDPTSSCSSTLPAPPCNVIQRTPGSILIQDDDYFAEVRNNNRVYENSIDNSDPDNLQAFFVVTLNRTLGDDDFVAINWETHELSPVQATAGSGNDFNAETGVVHFCGNGFGPYTGSDLSESDPYDWCVANGATTTSRNVPVTIHDDNVREGIESFEATISVNTPNVSINAGAESGFIDIEDNDYEITAFEDIYVNESGTATLRVNIVPSVDSSDTVSFRVVSHSSGGDTATLGMDYNGPAVTDIDVSGAGYGEINLGIIEDTMVEFAEYFTVTIEPTSDNLTFRDGIDNEALVNIDIDEVYEFSIADSDAHEDDGQIVFQVSLDNILSLTPNPDHAVIDLMFSTSDGTAESPDDFSGVSMQPFSIPGNPFVSPQEVSVTIVGNDGFDESPSEQFNAELSATGLPYESIITFNRAAAVGEIRDSVYVVTPSWNETGLDSVVCSSGCASAIGNEVAVEIPTLATDPVTVSPVTFTVTAAHRIHEVKIDNVTVVTASGVSGASGLAWLSVDDSDPKSQIYTFLDNTPPGSHRIDVLFDHPITMSIVGDGGSITHTSLNPFR